MGLETTLRSCMPRRLHHPWDITECHKFVGVSVFAKCHSERWGSAYHVVEQKGLLL